MALEERAGFKVGDLVPTTDMKLTISGDRAIGYIKESNSYIALATADTFLPAGGTSTPRLSDFRLLECSRGTPFAECVKQLLPGDNSKWRIKGPRTLQWLCEAHVELNMTPVARHYWWMQVLDLVQTDYGADEHQFLSEVIECGVARDFLNVCSLESFEQIARRYQMWEEFYSASLRAAECGEEGGEWLEERRLFLGAGRSKGQALVCPDLETHVSVQLHEEAQVLRERRKAREERRLARPDADEKDTKDKDKKEDGKSRKRRGGGGKGGP